MKTNNKKLFDMYANALKNGSEDVNGAYRMFWFWNSYTNEYKSFVENSENYNEAVKIATAITEGEKVEFEERRYALRAKNVKDNDGDDIYLMSYSGRLGVYPVLSLHSEKEWDGYFASTPYMHREDFEEVEE